MAVPKATIGTQHRAEAAVLLTPVGCSPGDLRLDYSSPPAALTMARAASALGMTEVTPGARCAARSQLVRQDVNANEDPASHGHHDQGRQTAAGQSERPSSFERHRSCAQNESATSKVAQPFSHDRGHHANVRAAVRNGAVDPTGPVLRVPAPTRLVEAMRLPRSSAAFGVDWETGNVVLVPQLTQHPHRPGWRA